MLITNGGAIVRLHQDGRRLKICLFSNPGPFPFGAPATMGKAQYLGISDHLVLTLMEDRYLAGLTAIYADVPLTPEGKPIRWCGGVLCQPWQGDIWYHIHPLFVRDVPQLLADARDLQLAACITGIQGAISRRQYWLVEIPAITASVLLNVDEIVIVRKRRPYAPGKPIPSKVARGEFWQSGAFAEDPAYAAMRRSTPRPAQKK